MMMDDGGRVGLGVGVGPNPTLLPSSIIIPFIIYPNISSFNIFTFTIQSYVILYIIIFQINSTIFSYILLILSIYIPILYHFNIIFITILSFPYHLFKFLSIKIILRFIKLISINQQKITNFILKS